MRLRLPRWLRRAPAQQGRHLRGTVPVSVPGAASALVSLASEPLLVPAPPPLPPPLPPDAVAAAVGDAGEPGEPGEAGDEPAPSEQVPRTDGDGAPTVALGFADGELHALPADDPRLTSFQDAAAAVLGRPEG